jgi:hypothetical protein
MAAKVPAVARVGKSHLRQWSARDAVDVIPRAAGAVIK